MLSLASEVFVNALVKFGLRKVAGLGFKGLVGKSETDFAAHVTRLTKIDKWYVNTHSSTDAKIQKIKSIAAKLGVKVQVKKI